MALDALLEKKLPSEHQVYKLALICVPRIFVHPSCNINKSLSQPEPKVNLVPVWAFCHTKKEVRLQSQIET